MTAGFDALVEVEKDGSSVVGTSIMGLMMLAASPGDEIEISASGPDAEAALAALIELVEAKFGEE
jgi:phosphocarrier protein